MANTSDEEMLKEFSIEAHDMLDQAESDLLNLSKGGDFSKFFDSIFRVFHSLKGGAGMLGMNALQKHMHALENALSGIKLKKSIDANETNYFLDGVDAGRKLLAGQSVQFNYEISEEKKADTPPAPAPAQKTPSESKVQPNSKTSAKNLAYVIDDEPDILENLSEILNSAEIQTRSFTNPLEALKEIDQNPPNIILTDMKMPELSGLALLAKVREKHPDLPVILISGYITTESLLDAIRLGVFGAIEKPFKVDVVLTYALAAIKQQRAFKMFRRGLNLLLYQFSDLEDFLKANGKTDEIETARRELTMLLSQWKELNQSVQSKNSK